MRSTHTGHRRVPPQHLGEMRRLYSPHYRLHQYGAVHQPNAGGGGDGRSSPLEGEVVDEEVLGLADVVDFGKAKLDFLVKSQAVSLPMREANGKIGERM